MPDPADAVIDAIIRTAPGHQPGTRPIHAPGVAATGWFQASTVAPAYTEAEHLSGRRVPVTVRFSNGTGEVNQLDTAQVVRGMAVRFHLGQVERTAGGVLSSARETDLVAVTLPAFFVRSVDRFLKLTEAATRRAPPPASAWRQVTRPLAATARMLRLEPRLEDLDPTGRALFEFANGHPPARLAMTSHMLLRVPESYATCAYHALHAFRLTAVTRTTFARFHWEPVAGVRVAGPEAKAAGRFLKAELAERLARSPVEFVLRIQVAEQGDDTSDPTTPWSQSRPRIVMGHLCLDALPADQDLGNEQLRFDPARLVPGIDVSDDPILQARSLIYRRSAARRSGSIA